ncbi:lipase family protein [Fluviicola sp. SGL-29]|nr:lipase family protein [Fluviicola sp. SGL-29]
MKQYRIIVIFSLLVFNNVIAQLSYTFSPGFIPQECDEILQLNDAFMNKVPVERFADSAGLTDYRFVYRSPAMGLDNLWDLWVRSDSTVVLMLRGTTGDPKSLLADFYCAMMPATGTVKLSETQSFQYKIAEHEQAAVHAGFLTGFAYIANDAQQKIDSLYKAGYHNYLVGGHSQGGSLVYYVSAWLYYLKKDGVYPDMQVKAYATAPPKMGNMYFVYNYDHIMRSEWAFSVTNSKDPVPEMPFTTQQLAPDMNEPNPLVDARQGLKKQPLIKRMFLSSAYNKMNKKAIKSAKSYQKYLGRYVGKFINGMVPGLQLPDPVNSAYFLRPGVPISFVPEQNYFDFYKDNKSPYYHHGIEPYRFLLRQQYEGLIPIEK